MPRPPAVPVSLVCVHARDGVRLDGAMVEPRRARKAALVWIHGLGSSFASGQPLMRALSARLSAAGVAYLKLNTRGHDVVTRAGDRFAGAAFERFTECVVDIRAAIALARSAGYTTVILAGHSTGANKALYYASRVRDRYVKGLMLVGPVSDIAGETKQIGPRELRRRVAVAERIAARDPEALVPRAFGFWTARRYLSLYRSGGLEDVFPYDRAHARWTALQRVRVPVAVLIGGRDEFLDRKPAELVDAFERHAPPSARVTGIVVPGARHAFRGREDALARSMVTWIRHTILLALVLASWCAGAACRKAPSPDIALGDRISTLRSLPDDQRARATRDLALEIRGVRDAASREKLALQLSSRATEGDFGRDTLQEVATTLASAVRDNANPNAPQASPDGEAYDELAQLSRYEHMTVDLDAPAYRAAVARLEDLDRVRGTADFTLTDLDGHAWTRSALKGKVVLVNFWATWCPPCRKEMPDLDALYGQFKSQGLVMLAISDEVEPTVKTYLAQHGVSYPVLLDPVRKVSDAMKIDSLPKTFVYDRTGALVAQSIDMRTRAQFLAMLADAGLR